MENPGYIALSRQMVLQRKMDVLAQNVANLTTPGYRAESLLFVEHLKRTAPGEKVRFVQDIATLRDLKTGPIAHTGNTFDLAIAGEGYFTDTNGDPDRTLDLGVGLPTDPRVSIGVGGGGGGGGGGGCDDNRVYIEKSGADLESFGVPCIPGNGRLLYWRESE